MAMTTKKKKPPIKVVKPKRAPVKKSPVKANTAVKEKPDRKGVGGRKKKAKVDMQSKVTVETELPLDLKFDKKGIAFLRWSAEMYYTTSVNDCSLRDMTKHRMFKSVSPKTLGTWSVEDRWPEKRQRMKDHIRNSIAAQVGSELARARLEQLHQLETLYNDAFHKLMNAPVVLMSYEKLLTAIIKLAETLDNFREKLANQIGPVDNPSTQAPGQMPIEARLNPDEIRALAKRLIQMNRATIRKERVDAEVVESGDEGTT